MKSADGRFIYCDKHDEPLPNGASIADVGRFRYRCRRRPDEWCSVNIVNAGYRLPQRSWTLSGTIDKPTLAPSINCQPDGGCWHGFIEDGIYKNTSRSPEAMQ